MSVMPLSAFPIRSLLRCCGALLVMASALAHAGKPVRVYAAASLTQAVGEIADQWQRAGHPRPALVFGASSTLARQIGAGAPADVFVSADSGWMDDLDRRGRITSGTRMDLLGNRLVMIAPRGRRVAIRMQSGFDVSRAFSGRLCMGEPGIVPAGTYARQALQSMGWWTALQPRVVGTEDVRMALAFVERGECALGIVYETDARISRRVDVLARFPAGTHAPIVYPVALVRGASPDASAFHRYLRTPQARAVFERHGFTRPVVR